MKKLAIALWISLYPTFLLAQNSMVHRPQNEHIIPLTTHEILYQSRSTTLTLKKEPTLLLSSDTQYQFDSDTTWNFDESMFPGTNFYTPTYFGQQFDLGNADNFIRHHKNFSWVDDTTGWVLNNTGMDWVNNDFIDSTKSYSLDNLGNAIYGSFYIYPKEPAEGATSEYYYSSYDADLGWVKESRALQYQNDEYTIYWYKNYRYNQALMEYVLDNESVSEELDTHSLYENKSYNDGILEYWTKRFSLYNEDGNTLYSTVFNYNKSLEILEPRDSTSFLYHEEFAEALRYKWSTNVWELDTYSRTYESPSSQSPDEMNVDSLITYEVVYDTQLDSMVAGIILTKSVWLYDDHDNLVEYNYYDNFARDMKLTNKTIYEYQLINGSYYSSINRSYVYSYNTHSLYLQSEFHTLMNEDGSDAGSSIYYYSESGEIDDANKTLVYFEGDTFYTFSYYWDPVWGDFIKSGFSMHSELEPVTQFSFESDWGNDRSIYVLDGLPTAVNPGPIFLALGDTLDMIISAMSPNLTVPDLAVTGLPAMATFNPETRRLYWIVDEEVADPFQITATRGAKNWTIDVKLVFGEFTVDSETETDIPAIVTLHQNYPNPFNPATTIGFELPIPQRVTLQVFNILGQTVQTLVQGELLAAGEQEFRFNAQNLSSGVYYYRLEVGNKLYTKKMTLIK